MTSVTYCRGKARACELLRNKPALKDEISVFYKKDASQEEIAVACKNFFLAWYGSKQFASLNASPFFRLKQMIAKQSVTNDMNLAVLPPASSSAKQHSLRA
jgi:hypothetical protein